MGTLSSSDDDDELLDSITWFFLPETLLSHLPSDVSFSSDFFSVINALVSTDEDASLSLAVVTDLAAFNDGFFSLDDD